MKCDYCFRWYVEINAHIDSNEAPSYSCVYKRKQALDMFFVSPAAISFRWQWHGIWVNTSLLASVRIHHLTSVLIRYEPSEASCQTVPTIGNQLRDTANLYNRFVERTDHWESVSIQSILWGFSSNTANVLVTSFQKSYTICVQFLDNWNNT